ncbi:MAG: methylamine utilization protein [Aliidiomarina sp.]|uniref:methylamine utilization protein n=1 Tax=Aliidiomarina sp. TaxID=1872439 RepID=UPI0025C2A139|nr:methylamine utilization protein [Aliidiomarina sp.]MCH8502107.1 methylamine utilization protein [Aliidiomarina sp.]
MIGWLGLSVSAANASPIWLFQDAQGAPLAGVILFQTQASEKPDDAAPSLTPQIHVMDQVQRQFVPDLLLVAAGDRISFPNSDSIRHHVYSFSPTRTFDFELYGNAEAPSIDFPQAGFVVVGCNIHDNMIGHIVVSATGEFLQSDDQGRMDVSGLSSVDGWYAWHPWMASAGVQPIAARDLTPDSVNVIAVEAPQPRAETDLESRFRRRLQGGR